MSYCMYYICLLFLNAQSMMFLSQDVLLILTSSVSLYFNLIFLLSNIIAFMFQKHRYYTAIV